ncbi:MAG: hypothetical protein O7A06_07395, partial [Acidobacteria bacterium]|nr:hypothetical protein [Acidobacteriota bacterium]
YFGEEEMHGAIRHRECDHRTATRTEKHPGNHRDAEKFLFCNQTSKAETEASKPLSAQARRRISIAAKKRWTARRASKK